ncbi:MAG: outer membrane lipoprotein LolB [Sutterellaceae bacterium]|nr:outer membrane lipoprotein LolB [Burkholderiaceae bacterium]MCX7901381.1 outer membrane lipoprotein LolB [Burkholderiaceae bacterium]MDW8430266.1 outer membrane lipoprotein LolB [Sutterellaceae bacterium]
MSPLAPALAAFSLALLAACSTLPRTEPRAVVGRFSVVVATDSGQDASAGRFVLACDDQTLTLELASPLGSTLARLQVDRDGARLLRADGKRPLLQGADVESLTQAAFGWPLPVAGFADWIAGRPCADRPFRVRGPDTFEQDGWTVLVLERFAAGAPRRLQIERPPQPGGTPGITMRLVLERPGADGPRPACEARKPVP